jgi:hypothetical protein
MGLDIVSPGQSRSLGPSILADDGDALDFVRRKIDLSPVPRASSDPRHGDQNQSSSPPELALALFTPEQNSAASQIIEAVMSETDQPKCVQGSAGTGKPLTVSVLIKAFGS